VSSWRYSDVLIAGEVRSVEWIFVVTFFCLQ